MQLSILGPVLVDGRAPRGAKERALLARLLVAPGTPVPADTLIEAAWAPDRHDGVTRSLHVRIAKLRALLDRERRALVRDAAGYRLAVCPDRSTPSGSRLAEEAAAGRPRTRWPSRGGARAVARRAVRRSRARRRRRDRRGAPAARDPRPVRRTRAAALSALGRAEEAAQALAALVAEDPLREELVADLMTARYAAGRHAEALDAYRELAARLADVGLGPGRGSASSRRRCCATRTSSRRRAGSDERRRPGGEHRRAREELAAVAGALRAHRIVTLVGPAGVGKTTLAAEAARQQLDRMPDGAWLVELGPLRGADEVLPAVGNALGIRRVGTGGEEGDRDALGVLRDGSACAGARGPRQRRAPRARPRRRRSRSAAAGDGVGVLVTSRRPLGLAAEAVVPVRPLDADTAEELFLARASAARPDWVADAGERDAVARICRRIDGLPLAIELAAARLRALSAAAIAERLDAASGSSAAGRSRRRSRPATRC